MGRGRRKGKDAEGGRGPTYAMCVLDDSIMKPTEQKMGEEKGVKGI
jgi:hypothetical protein